MVSLIIARKNFGPLEYIGLGPIKIIDYGNFLYFLPLLIIELVVPFFGIREGLNLPLVLKILFCSLAVGLAEESFSRGLIPNFLRQKGLKAVIILSSVFFALGHLANILAGASPLQTILQVLFALSFAILAIIIRLLTDSLIIPIVWHAGHNFLSWITIEGDFHLNFLFGTIQIIVYLAYAYYLWKNHKDQILKG